MLTLARLRYFLWYEPETGDFIRRSDGRKLGFHRVNKARPKDMPYWRINVDGRFYQAGRLAWFYMTGEWPKHEIDHINRNSLDDRWANLREATRSQNQANTNTYRSNQSGFKGVHRRGRRWRAILSVDGRNRNIGTFDTPEQARDAFVVAAKAAHSSPPSNGTLQ